MTAAVQISGVTKRFDDVVAVDSVDLEIADGEFFAMHGLTQMFETVDRVAKQDTRRTPKIRGVVPTLIDGSDPVSNEVLSDLRQHLGDRLLDSAVFPGMQGGPLMHVIAAKAVAFGEALQPEFKEYARARGLYATWKHLGFPRWCHAVGEDDFECD